YRCVVKDSSGNTVTSNAATLTVLGITKQPASVTSAAGKTVTFTVTATGTGLTYQWQYSKDNGATWSNSSTTGYNTDTLSVGAIAARNGYLYRCVVKSGGVSVTSSSAKLTVE
ncbi:MAG: hypothetical protein IKX85_01270, partial [Clostridia bacterium]|nr:hypothetical protein [Clostridia bacterium]